MRSTERLGDALGVALQQHNLLSAGQLVDAGFTYREISRLRQDGVIERVIRGLYRLPGTSGQVQSVAAVLMRHPDGLASHRSALLLHGLGDGIRSRPEFTLPGASATARSSLGTLHRSPVDDCDRTILHGLPATATDRTVVDASQCLSEAEVADLVNVVVSRRLTTPSAIEAAAGRVEKAVGRRGHAVLRKVLAPWTDAITPDSPAEAAVFRRIRDAGLLMPVTQFEIRDSEGRFVARADLAWPAQRVAREYDSDRFHGPERIEADEARRIAIESAGWRVGVINRRDLRPSSRAWLNRLASDLGAGRRHVA